MSLPTTPELRLRAGAAAAQMGFAIADVGDGPVPVRSPIAGLPLGSVSCAVDVDVAVATAVDVQRIWRTVPAPQRGQLVRRFGELLRAHQEPLAELVTIETGKILAESRGEVQEMVDICEFAVGLSRQLHGLTIASERCDHRLSEYWHPLGVAAIVTAFNFPVAVFSWNAALALVCGDAVVWKPSDKTMMSSLATMHLLQRAADEVGAPCDVATVVAGGPSAAIALAEHPDVALLSATGSTAMGANLAPRVAARFGRSLLELGGNNAAIVAPSADLDLTARGVTFAAAGTAGQRCTTLRRLIVHRSRHDEVVERLARVYATLPVGDPLGDGTLVGPLIDGDAHRRIIDAISAATSDGGVVHVGGDRVLAPDAPAAYYLRPAIVSMPAQTDIVRTETFGPLLYTLVYDDLDEAIALNNAATHGLSSSIFTNDLREAERFCGPQGSDCGITNVNIGPSGAEIGGAFGGEKETGGGRESGSDSWKAYMRRATATINYGTDLPLAQGLRFDATDAN